MLKQRGTPPGGKQDRGRFVSVVPASNLERGGRVAHEVLWAALDCPGYFAVGRGQGAVLGRIQGRVTGSVDEGIPCAVVAWPIAADGRKLHAGTALFTAEGRLLGLTSQIWIELPVKR